ncbi:MAG TPA: energy transducer TonB [Gemmatimonadales bacterium]|nr:energy transducer TonB [Gemmatimonadales bacterium]
MFDTLIVSKPQKQGILRRVPQSMFSLVTHAVLIWFAVQATMKGDTGPLDAGLDTNMVFLEEEKPEEPQEPEAPPPPPKGFSTLLAPIDIPTSIPPINLNEKFDPNQFSGVGVELGVAEGLLQTGPVDLTQIFVEAVVDEPPERISFPPPEYPRILLEARVEGTVVLEAVIDTTGHAEPNSIKVVSSTNRAFEAPARDAMRRALFRPGRVRGQAVRVLVQMPLRFVIPGGGQD